MISVEIRQLECFRAVLSAGSITGAARLVGTSQPAVTRAIKELETEIGFALLHRNGPRISPTDRGLLFHEEVDRILSGLGHLKERAAAIAEQRPLSIEIAGIPAMTAGMVAPTIERVAGPDWPQQVHVRSMPAEKVLQAVALRTADIGLSSFPLDHTGLDLLAIGEAPCVAVLSESDPLARRGVLSMKDFADRPLIAMSNPFRQRRRVMQAFATAGIEPNLVLDTDSSLNALQLVRAGLGVTIIEPVTAYGVPLPGLAVRPVEAHIPFLWGVVCAAGRPSTSFLNHFVEALDTLAEETLPGYRRFDPNAPHELARVREMVHAGTPEDAQEIQT